MHEQELLRRAQYNQDNGPLDDLVGAEYGPDTNQ
jgi:hypothetical protein